MSGADRQQLPKHILKDKDRYGNVRYYYRRPGLPMVRLRAEPGSPEFMAQYEAAKSGICNVSDPPDSYVYFFRQQNLVKIGTSKRPAARLESIKTGNAKHIEWHYSTPGGRQLEQELHRKFAEYRVKREWFLFAPEIRLWIDADHQARLDKIKAENDRIEALGLSRVRQRRKLDLIRRLKKL